MPFFAVFRLNNVLYVQYTVDEIDQTVKLRTLLLRESIREKIFWAELLSARYVRMDFVHNSFR